MLRDLTNNFARNTTNTGFPNIILNPQQIFGNDLWIWYDFNDTRSLFSDTGFTTNVINTGEIIRGVLNKGNDSNYNLTSLIPSGTTGTTQSVLSYSRNSVNSNKNSAIFSYTGGAVNAQFGSLQSVSATTTSSEVISAYTQSGVIRLGNTNNTNGHIVGGLRSNKLVPFFVRPTTDNQYSFRLINPSQTIDFGNAPKRVSERYMFYTFTVDSNNNLYLNINNQFITALTITNIYPIVGSIASNGGRFVTNGYDGTSFSVRSETNMELLEYCASYRTALTEEQINSLHQYYKIKYNL